MKRILYIAAMALFCIAAASCEKDEVTPHELLNLGRYNWFEVKDSPDDQVQHALYTFFRDSGIPLFLNDTIGSLEMKTMFDQSYTHYEVLKLYHMFGGVYSTADLSMLYVSKFTRCDSAAVPAALQFLEEVVVPVVKGRVHVHSILLTESFDAGYGTYVFKGYNTIIVGSASRLSTLTADQRTKFKAEFIRCAVYNQVMSYADQISQFYQVSRSLSPYREIYAMQAYEFNRYLAGTDIKIIPTSTGSTSYNDLGFLGHDPRQAGYAPMHEFMDVYMYLEEMVSLGKAGFEAKYASYAYIMKKYGYLRAILDDLGIAF